MRRAGHTDTMASRGGFTLMETHQAPDSNTEAIKVRDNSLIYEYKVATEGTSAVCDATATATHGASVASGAAA